MKRKQYTNPFMPVNATFAKAMRDYSIWFHLLEEGEEVEDGLTALYAMTCTLNAARPSETLRKSLVIMEAIHTRGTWSKADLMPMVSVLGVVGEQYPQLPRDVARKAIAEVMA